jgi:hypothetical protein
MQRCLCVLVVAGLIASLGCGDIGGSRRNASGSAGGAGLVAPDQQVSQPPTPSAVPSPGAAPGAPAMPAGALQAATGQAGQAPAGQPGPAIPGLPVAGAAPQQPAMVQEKAQAGVTGKGNYGGPGIITTPISTYFQIRERAVFDIQIPQAMQLYEATNGAKPKTQDEFMRNIIQANMIKLPELPAGHKYVYDPQKGELMVEHPQ